MEAIITSILAAAPYMAPTLYLVYQQQKRIAMLEDQQRRMIDWFMEHSEMSAQQAENIRSGST